MSLSSRKYCFWRWRFAAAFASTNRASRPVIRRRCRLRWHASCMTVTALSYPVLSFDALAPLLGGGAGTSKVSEEAPMKAGQSGLQRTLLQARRAGVGSGPHPDSERQARLCRRQLLRQRPLAHRHARRLAGSGDRWLATRTRAHVQKLLPQQRPGRSIGRRWKVSCSYHNASGQDRRGGTEGNRGQPRGRGHRSSSSRFSIFAARAKDQGSVTCGHVAVQRLQDVLVWQPV